jgi:hypothetical protein
VGADVVEHPDHSVGVIFAARGRKCSATYGENVQSSNRVGRP